MSHIEKQQNSTNDPQGMKNLHQTSLISKSNVNQFNLKELLESRKN